MSLREEQCKKVCRILDDVLANRPTERDSLIVAVRKAFESLEQFGNSEPLPSAQPEPKRGEWLERDVIDEPKGKHITQWQSARCSVCGRYHTTPYLYSFTHYNFCPNCGADMRGELK